MNSTEVFNTLEVIAITSSRTEKEQLVEAALTDPLFRECVKLATDPFITFGITPPKVKACKVSGIFDLEKTWVWVLLASLAERKLTGNAAKTAVENALADLEPKSAELLRRILAKDLRAGFSKNTINRVMPGTIPTFDVMLSKPFEAKRVKAFPIGVEPKLDGFRTMFLVKDGTAKAFSRVGNHYPAYDHLSDQIAAMIEAARHEAAYLAPGSKIHELFHKMLGTNHPEPPRVAIDAETLSGGFAETSSAARRKEEAAENVTVHVFDALPYDRATSDDKVIAIPFKLRRAFAEFLVAHKPEGAPIVMTDLRFANSLEEIQAIYAEHREAGREGAMVKPLDGPYEKKKGHGWMKMKAEETEDLRIVGWFEGEANTKLEGKFGGFIVTRAGVEIQVGGGFKDAEREEFLPLVKALINSEPYRNRGKLCTKFDEAWRLCEVEYHEVTPDGSLRHPRFVRFRDDKDEKLRDAA